MRLLIFDLDGTLIDSSQDLVISTNAMLRHLGRPEIDEKTVNSYVGDGAPKLVRRALGGELSDAEFNAAYSFFIRYYRDHSLEHTDLYPGIRDALDELRSPDTVLAVLTNKPVKISYDILAGLNLAEYFFRVYGGDSFPSKKPDPVGIHTLVREANVERESAVMIGDSSVDIATAKNAGVRSVGVSWGFKPESLNDPPADVIIHEQSQLVESLRAARQ